MIPTERILFQVHRFIAFLALLAACEVLLADTLIAAEPPAVEEPRENIEGPPSTPDRAGPIPEDAVLKAEELREQGEKSLLEGQYASAREYFASAASLDPHDPRSRISQAFSEFAMGDFENAATTVREVMKMAPDLAATPLDMRGLFGEIGIIEKQLAKLEEITQLHSQSSRMYFLLGFVRYYSGDRASGTQTLLEYMAANPEDLTIQPFIEIAGSVNNQVPQPDRRSMAQQSERPPNAEPVEPPEPPRDESVAARRPPLEDRPLAANEPPREYPPSRQRIPHGRMEPRYFRGPRVQGPATLVEPRRPEPQVVFASAPESDNLAEFAVRVFCHEEGLDPFDNDVVARVTDEDVDEDTGALTAEIEMHWVEWQFREDRRGRVFRRAKPQRETIQLEFDERGRLTDYDD